MSQKRQSFLRRRLARLPSPLVGLLGLVLTLTCFQQAFAVCLQTDAAVDQITPLTDDEAKQLDRLIQQLGAAEYSQRASAKKEIRAFGQKALPKLIQAAGLSEVGDFEIQLVVKELIDSLKKDSLDEQLEAFREGSGDLPGWAQFAETFGDNQGTRSLYANMFQIDAKLLKSIVEDEINLSTAINYASVSSRSSSKVMFERLALGWYAVGTLLQRGGRSAAGVSQSYRLSMLNMLTRSNVKMELSQREDSESFRKVIHRTMALLKDEQPLLNAKISAFLMLGDQRSTQQLIAYMENPELAMGTRVYLMARLTELPTEVHPAVLQSLETQMRDQQVFGTFVPSVFVKDESLKMPRTLEVRVCDVALLVAIALESRRPDQFGLIGEAIVDGKGIEVRLAGFVDDERRQAGFAEWASRPSRKQDEKDE